MNARITKFFSIKKSNFRIVAPSILSADFSCLQKDIRQVESAGARWLHIDIMDGHFVPNITIGPSVVKAIRRTTKMFLDVHLMIEEPSNFVKQFIDAGADGITFHIESTRRTELVKLLKYVKNRGILSGVSLKPRTNPEVLRHFLKFSDLILVMSVEPGFGGQRYIPSSTEKIRRIKKLTTTLCKNPPLISVDGGIDENTIKDAASAGADIFVAGNAIFSSKNNLSAAEAYKRLSRIVGLF